MNTPISWNDRKIYHSLPSLYSSFQSLDFVNDSGLIVEFFELIYKVWNDSLITFLDFDGDYDNFSDEQLDAIAPYYGFTEQYYNELWDRERKICLFMGVYHEPYIWKFRGTQEVLEYVIKCFDLDAKVSKPSGFIAGVATAGDVCGAPNLAVYDLVIPIEYLSTGIEVEELKYIVKHYTGKWTRFRLRYTTGEYIIDGFTSE